MVDTKFPVRRQYARFKINASAGLRSRGPGLADILLKNISAQGACGILSTPVETNQEVELVIEQPTVKNRINEKGRVVWQKSKLWGKREVGLKFNFLDLNNFTDKLISAQGQPINSANSTIALSELIDFKKIIFALVFLVLLAISLSRMPIFQGPNSLFYKIRNPLANFRNSFTLRLDGIVYDSSGESFVTINSQILTEGESYKGRIIRRINKDSVAVSYRGREQLIPLIQESK